MSGPAGNLGFPAGAPAPELVEAGFALEVAEAPFLHAGLNLADMAHLLDLLSRRLVPLDAAARLLDLLLEVHRMPATAFPYDAAYGDPYNCRERYFVERIGDDAGWLHAGRPRREAARLAFRIGLRHQALELVVELTRFVEAVAVRAAEQADTLMPDQTYLQQAQPSTFGHYLLSFAYPMLRDSERMMHAADWVDASPAGAGCVNGSRLLPDRGLVADLLGFSGIIEHTRDAMWQTDGLVELLAVAADLVSTESKLAEDLEIWDSQEFDFVDLADAYTRASVLMPQKRNPYALAIVRGATGVLIGRLAGFLAVVKSPSARSDNLIFAYGEVPRSLELARQMTRLMTGVVETLETHPERMLASLDAGFSQATDLAEFVMARCDLDYRTAYVIVGEAVRRASREGRRGVDLTARLLDEAAAERTGRPLGLVDADLAEVLDPRAIVATRVGIGGAAPDVVCSMARSCVEQAGERRGEAARRLATFEAAEDRLLQRAREVAGA